MRSPKQPNHLAKSEIESGRASGVIAGAKIDHMAAV